jgi:C4-dicarboxylate-specific signal transduction histidine kinase
MSSEMHRIPSAAADWDRREAELQRSEAFLAQAERLTKSGSAWWKASTGDVKWSDGNYHLMEYPVSVTPALQMTLDRCHPDDLQLVEEMLAVAMRDEVTVDFEHRLLMPSGAVKYVHVVIRTIRGDSEEPEFLAAATDTTEWKETEEKLRRSEESLGTLRSELVHAARVASLGTLAASIAHEINQPLTGIVTNASTCLRMLASDPPEIDGARETARRAIRDGNRAAEIISTLRDLFSRKTPTAEAVDLNGATREVLALMRSELRRGRVIQVLDLAEGLPSVLGDRVQLQQVIINLLRNAVEAGSGTKDGRREIVITTTLDEAGCVCLSVRDSGVGFEPRHTERMFDAFYTTKHDGMGIGLSVCRLILERHRGRLWAAPNDGGGATFSLAVPCASRENSHVSCKLAS